MQKIQETQVWSLGQEDLLEEEMTSHSSILAWRIPGTREPVGLPSLGWHRVGHDWSDLAKGFPGGSDGKKKKKSTCNVGELDSIPALRKSTGGRHGNPLQYSCLENPHRQRSLVGYGPRGHKELDTTEQLSTKWGTIIANNILPIKEPLCVKKHSCILWFTLYSNPLSVVILFTF